MLIREISPAAMATSGERRNADRRQTNLRSLLFGGIGKHRRRGPRRISDHHGYYVDWYEPRLLAVAVSIFLLCCIDACFTLALLSRGASEVNILMDMLIQWDVDTFVRTKLAMTAAGLIFLVAHSSFRLRGLVLVRHVLYLLLGSYTLLFVYQLNLLVRLPQSV